MLFTRHFCVGPVPCGPDCWAAVSMRVFVRLPSGVRTKIMVLPDTDDLSFSAFKVACATKLGLNATCGDQIKLLLSSNLSAGIKVDIAPEVEALDEISPEDLLIVMASTPHGECDAKTHKSGDADEERAEKEAAEEEEEEEVVEEGEEEGEEDGEEEGKEEEEEEEEEDGEEEEPDSKELQIDADVKREHDVDGGLASERGEIPASESTTLSQSRPRRSSLAATEKKMRESSAHESDDASWSGCGPTETSETGQASGGDSGGGSGRKRARPAAEGPPTACKARVREAKAPPRPTIEAVLDDDAENRGGDNGGNGSGSGCDGTGAASAEERGSGSSSEADGSGSGELDRMKARIRKLLKLGLHAGTPETEAAR